MVGLLACMPSGVWGDLARWEGFVGRETIMRLPLFPAPFAYCERSNTGRSDVERKLERKLMFAVEATYLDCVRRNEVHVSSGSSKSAKEGSYRSCPFPNMLTSFIARQVHGDVACCFSAVKAERTTHVTKGSFQPGRTTTSMTYTS